MKVYIGPYKNWFGPYQLAEKLCFWAKPVPDEYGILDKPEWVHKFGEWLAHGSIEPEPKVGEVRSFRQTRHNTWLYGFLMWLETKRERKISVRIDRHDTWSMDNTLAYIVLPMLKQLKDQKQGSPYVDDDDVPEHLRSTAAPSIPDEYSIDANHHLRWDWVLDEMIFSFASKLDDSWEDQFTDGEYDWSSVTTSEDGTSEIIAGTHHTVKTDWEAKTQYQARITNGFRLFGKYYEGLWS